MGNSNELVKRRSIFARLPGIFEVNLIIRMNYVGYLTVQQLDPAGVQTLSLG